LFLGFSENKNLGIHSAGKLLKGYNNFEVGYKHLTDFDQNLNHYNLLGHSLENHFSGLQVTWS
jgi:hypothetical protein